MGSVSTRSATLNQEVSRMVPHFPIFHAWSQVPAHMAGSVHFKADPSHRTDLFIASGGRMPTCSPGRIPIRVLPTAPSWRELFRDCCTAQLSELPPAALRAAAGKSNYRLGNPWGITESISRRPACRWQLFALGTREPQCRENKNKVSCPADVGLRHMWKLPSLVIIHRWSITIIVLAQTLWAREHVPSLDCSELCVWDTWLFCVCWFKDSVGNQHSRPVMWNIRIFWVQLCPACTNGF